MAHINPRLDPQATKILNITRSTLSCKSTARYGAKKNKLHGNRRVRRKMDSKLLAAEKLGCTCLEILDDATCAICDFTFEHKDKDFGFFPCTCGQCSGGGWSRMVDVRRDFETLSMAIKWANYNRTGKDDAEWIGFLLRTFPNNLIGRHAVFHILWPSGIKEEVWRHLV